MYEIDHVINGLPLIL